VAPPEEALQTYGGYYATAFGVVGITPRSDTLEAKIAGEDGSYQLVPCADGLLGVRRKLLGMVPLSLGELGQVGFSLATVAGHGDRQGPQEGAGDAGWGTPPAGADPRGMTKTWGEYEVVNGDDDLMRVVGARLYQQYGLLLAEVEVSFSPQAPVEKQPLALAPQTDREAVICGLGRGMGETIRVIESDSEEGLSYSGYLLKKKHR